MEPGSELMVSADGVIARVLPVVWEAYCLSFGPSTCRRPGLPPIRGTVHPVALTGKAATFGRLRGTSATLTFRGLAQRLASLAEPESPRDLPKHRCINS
jgi:hypothetical protein